MPRVDHFFRAEVDHFLGVESTLTTPDDHENYARSKDAVGTGHHPALTIAYTEVIR